MDGKTLTDFCSLLSNMPSSKDTPWRDSALRMYQLGLSKVPNEAFKPLAEAVLLRCKFRPSVSEIVDLWHEISDKSLHMPITEVLMRIKRLITKYGEFGRTDPAYPPTCRFSGEPAELESAPEPVKEVIAAWGGWVALCREDCEPMVFRAQFERLYKSACSGIGNQDLREIRRQFQLEQAAQPLLEDTDAS